MPADGDPRDAPPPAPRVSLLRCRVCGHTVECKPADLIRYIQAGWPKCCGQVMPLFLPADPEVQEPPEQ